MRQLRLLCALCRSGAVLGPAHEFAALDTAVFADEFPDRGALGGIYTGLRRMRTEFGLFLGCDLPYMNARFLKFLAGRALAVGARVTVPESPEHQYEPLGAVYRRRAARAIRSSLLAGEDKTSGLYSRVRCTVIPWSETARAGFAPSILANMNSQEDCEAALRRISGL